MMRPSSFGSGVMIYAGCIAVTAYVMWPSIRGHLPRSWGHIVNMRLDPGEVSPNVEDRRGEHGRLGHDAGGDDIGRDAPRWPRPPYTDGRNVEVPRPRPADDEDSPRFGRRQVKVCSSPWWSPGPLRCGPWQEDR
jgi:hypothetical protein